jgi:hypothetical protein
MAMARGRWDVTGDLLGSGGVTARWIPPVYAADVIGV